MFFSFARQFALTNLKELFSFMEFWWRTDVERSDLKGSDKRYMLCDLIICHFTYQE